MMPRRLRDRIKKLTKGEKKDENPVTTGESNAEGSSAAGVRLGKNYGLDILYEPPDCSKAVVE